MFRINDRVLCFDAHGGDCHLRRGSVYLVSWVGDNEGDQFLGLVGVASIWYAGRFELAERRSCFLCGEPMDAEHGHLHSACIDRTEAWSAAMTAEEACAQEKCGPPHPVMLRRS